MVSAGVVLSPDVAGPCGDVVPTAFVVAGPCRQDLKRAPSPSGRSDKAMRTPALA